MDGCCSQFEGASPCSVLPDEFQVQAPREAITVIRRLLIPEVFDGQRVELHPCDDVSSDNTVINILTLCPKARAEGME
eukprot:8383227-Heterocapsa_arctica.AAC.1